MAHPGCSRAQEEDAVRSDPRDEMWPIEDYRDYLLVLARLQVGAHPQVTVDPSDLVQQAILQAHEKQAQFRGLTEVERLGWLRAILANVLAGVFRHVGTQSRDFARELSLDVELERSSSRMEALLAADQSSPSERVVRSEQLLLLARALARLPDDQRRVVELHYLKGLKVADVAQEIGRSRPAAAGLIFRALNRLRELLRDSREAPHVR
jgi:RNA polymerase sigma-70 factor (ECF subfamily)